MWGIGGYFSVKGMGEARGAPRTLLGGTRRLQIFHLAVQSPPLCAKKAPPCPTLVSKMDSFPDIFGIVGKFGEEFEEPLYLTSFEVLVVEEVQDELLRKVGSPFVRMSFRPRMRLPKLPLRFESIFSASTWASPGYSFESLFPIHGSEYAGFSDEGVGQTGWRPQLDGTLYASRDDARDACGKRYRGIAVVELWPIHLLSKP